jgi:hypothetical protein
MANNGYAISIFLNLILKLMKTRYQFIMNKFVFKSKNEIYIFLLFLFIVLNVSNIHAQVNLKPFKCDNGKWGYIDEKGKTTISCCYETATEFLGKFAIVEEGYQKYFLINEKGKKLNKEPYEMISRLSDKDNSFLTRKTTGYNYSSQEWAFNVINQKGKKIFEKDCKSIEADGSIIIFSTKSDFEKKYSYGIANSKGDIIIKPMYDYRPSFSASDVAVVRQIISDSYKYGFLKNTGEYLIPCIYEDGGKVNSSLFWGKTADNKYQFINSKGVKLENLLVDEFKIIDSYGNALMQIRKGDKWGLSKGYEIIVNCMYDKIEAVIAYHTDQFIINENNKYGVIDTSKNVIVPAKFNSIKKTRNSIFLAYSDAGTHLYKSGKEITVLPKDIEVYDFSYGFAKIKKNGLFGYIDTTGNIVIPCKYNLATDFAKDSVWVVLNGEFKGYIDKTGKQVSENEYIRDKRNEILAAEKEKAEAEDRKKFIDKNFPYQYSDVFCSLRMSAAPSKNKYETISYGSRRDVNSVAIANDVYVIGCMLSYVVFNESEANALKAKNITLLDATLKGLERGTGISTETLSDYNFNTYKGQKYTYFFKDHYFKAVNIQKNNTIFSVTLFGPKPFDDKIFDTYIGTFEIK